MSTKVGLPSCEIYRNFAEIFPLCLKMMLLKEHHYPISENFR